MQSTLSGFVKQKVAVEGHEGWHTYDTVDVQVGVDWIHLENNRIVVTNFILQRILSVATPAQQRPSCKNKQLITTYSYVLLLGKL